MDARPRSAYAHAAGRSFLRSALIVFAVGGCVDRGAGTVYVLPGEISVRAGESFALRARALDHAGGIIPDGAVPKLRWTHGNHLACDVCDGPVAQLRSQAAGTSHVEVAAGRWPAKRTNRVTVRVVQSTATPSQDWLRAPHTGSAFPAAVLASGLINSQPVRDALVRLVAEGPLGSFTCPSSTVPCGEVTLFAPHASLSRRSVYWSGGVDVQDLTDLNPARMVPLATVYIRTGTTDLASQEVVEAAVLDDIATARKVLRDNWTGLLLQPTLDWGWPTTVVLASDHSCTGDANDLPSVYAQLVEAGVPKDEFGPQRLVAAYVQALMEAVPSGGARVMGSTFGWACPWHPEYGSIVLMPWLDRPIPTTFTHELLHGVALGHTPLTPDYFGRSNIMSPGQVSTASRRTYLSLGQGFRMSMSDKSIFQRGGTAVTCTADASDDPCPRLSRDLVRP